MHKKILGLDLGSNSIGWALLEESKGKPDKIIDLGSRIFIKAVEEKNPTPKNVKRRDSRLSRRVIQRRTRRKQRMMNYLMKLGLLPVELKNHTQPEIILNTLGEPYGLRAKALDEELQPYELGRVLYHIVQRRGFLSNRKTLLGDMIDDPDVQAILQELESEDDNASAREKEETAFKKDISELRDKITHSNSRTLGEYLSKLDQHQIKRNRQHEGGHLRTDRQMYRDELERIWKQQRPYHDILSLDVIEQIENIIFYQRPLKLSADRIGKCSLEPSRKRIHVAKLEYQRFRYLQDINNLRYFEPFSEEYRELSCEDREKLIELFEQTAAVSFTEIRKVLGLDKKCEFNLEQGNKKLKGNVTACEIRKIIPGWNDYSSEKQQVLLEDLLTIRKKSVLKKRLVTHWNFDGPMAVNLCMLEFEPDHGNLSLKAINKLLPYLEKGQLYSEARINAGYGYEVQKRDITERLGAPPSIANPIVQKALNELRRLINAIISEYGKPDIIRIEMARDLEMNTKRYKNFLTQQKANTKANEDARAEYSKIGESNPSLGLSKYPGKTDKLKYRLWKDQDHRCAYSGKTISLGQLFKPETEIDHILPYSQSLDDSYMNKVICFTGENRNKGQRTPVDAFGGNEEKWNQITQAISRWDKRKLRSKIDRFYTTESQLTKRDFISSQLNDTRYISRVALEYLKPLGADINTCKGITTSWLRHMWGLNNLIGEANEKERNDHRHHAIDAIVIACIDRSLYTNMVTISKELESKESNLTMKDIYIDPPWGNLKADLHKQLEATIISHTPHRKLSGALHKETGAGFIDGQGNVVRRILDGGFKTSHVKKILDDTVREIVKAHLEKYNNKPKDAFSENITVYHLDGKTPIKRVRTLQSETNLEKLEKTKFGVRNKDGKVFKWLAYGNIHHIEVIREKETGEYSGIFVTMMEASHRVKGINMPKQSATKTNHGDSHAFVMALHINDTVSIEKDGKRKLYRLRKLGQLSEGSQPRPTLNYHVDSKTKIDELSDSIANLLGEFKLQKHDINVLGKKIND